MKKKRRIILSVLAALLFAGTIWIWIDNTRIVTTRYTVTNGKVPEAFDGFVIAQKDLEIRGAGEFFGTRQHGEPQMPALMLESDARLLARTRDAFLELSKNPEYYAERRAIMEAAGKRFHKSGAYFARN